MIAFDNETKQAYKDYNREIKVYGNLYLAKKHTSKNLFSTNDEPLYSTGATVINNSSYLKVTRTLITNWNYTVMPLNNVLGKTIYFKCDYTSTSLYPGVYLFGRKNGSLVGNAIASAIAHESSGELTFNYTFPSTMPSEYDEYVILFYANTYSQNNAQIGEYTLYSNVMASENEDDDYEEYGVMVNDYTQFALTEENECKILGFNINEKTDIYYTSLPYNTMEIEVDNEKGYFTDYDPDSIVNKLNQDCYVDLFISINDGDYIKIMTMKFDEISSSDYEKAKLSFKSSISILSNLMLKDKDKSFYNSYVYKNDLISYYKNNYNLNLVCDNTTNDMMYRAGYTNVMTPESILLNASTRYGTLEKAVLTINDSQDNIVQRTWKKDPQDTILLDYQQEKPIVKREDVYRGVQRKYINNANWESSTETYNYVISGKLTAVNEYIGFFDPQYKINDITNNDITIIGNVSVNVYSFYLYEYLTIRISGNIGDEYTITLNKANITKRLSNNYKEETIGSTEDTTKVLKITETAPLMSGYYQFILSEKQVKSNIEAKIFGLPYLEIGDTVEIETELAKILMTITEIDMNYDGGLLETIKGYELGWDALFPADDLYPSDDLYPNTPIN